MSDQLQGVDVSKWQGRIDWQEAKHQIGFAMVKATQGIVEVDPDYNRDITALREAGELRGSYHYPNGGDPAEEARFYVQHAGRHDGEMQALDFEGAVLSASDPVGWAAAWLAKVTELTDNVPLIYMSGAVVTAHDWRRVIALNTGLWVASWDVAPVHHIGQWPFVIMWQRDDTGRLRGINGQVDDDVFFGNAALWARYARNRSTSNGVQGPKPRKRLPIKPKKKTPAKAPARKPARRAPAKPTPAEPASYTVKAGDTLSAIAHAHGVTVAELVAANEHRYESLNWNPDLIQVGWQLAIPNR